MNIRSYVDTIRELHNYRESVNDKLIKYGIRTINVGIVLIFWLVVTTLLATLVGVDFTFFMGKLPYNVIVAWWVFISLSVILHAVRKIAYHLATRVIQSLMDELFNACDLAELSNQQWRVLKRAGWELITRNDTVQVDPKRETAWLFVGDKYVRLPSSAI